MAEGIYRIKEFRGLDQSEADMSIAEGASPDLQNVRCEGGVLYTVKGSVKYSAHPVPGGIHSLAALYSRDQPRLLAANEGGVYTLEDGGEWRLLYEAQGIERLSFLNYAKDGQDVVLLATGKQPLWWDGEADMEPLPDAPQGIRHLALHYERVWAAGIEEEPDTVHWSRAYDPADWTPDPTHPEAGGGFVLIPTWNGGRVRGLKNYFNDVVVFKDEDIFRVYGTYPGNYEVVRVHGILGPIAERTIVPWGERVYFFSRDGLCAYNGLSAAPIDKGRADRFFSGVDYELARETACAVIHRDRLYLALPEVGAGANSAILEVDLRRGAWTIRRGVRADDFLIWGDRLLFCNDTGYVFALDEGDSYDGAPIDAYWEGRWNDFGSKTALKRGGEVRALGQGLALLRQMTDRGERVGSIRFPPEGGIGKTRLRGVARIIKLRIENLAGRPFRLEDGLEWELETDEE